MHEHLLRETLPTEPADLVEALWERLGREPDLKDLLSHHPQWSPREVRDALLVDQQFRWRTSRPWRTEDYQAVAPALAADDELTLDLIFGEVRGRTHQGTAPSLAELVHRFPHLRQRLERQLEIASWFADAGGRPGEVDEEESADETEPAAVRFGDFDLCCEIARGGMGIVYRARHRKLKRCVALKMIRPERLMRAADLRRFKNETRIIARLDHPNIIPILQVGQVDGVHYFTMRMVHGRDLESRRTEYLADLRGAVRLVWAVAAAIHHAHLHGVLHRDLKPSNVLVDDAGVPYVVDFGLARHVAEVSDLTASGDFLGTPAYAAPEQFQQESRPLTVAADVYGLGAILYVLITGQPPFAGQNPFEVWEKVCQREPPPPRTINPRVDPDLQAICLKAMEKNPDARYASAAALVEDLERYLAHEPVSARPISWWQRRWRRVQRHPARAALRLASGLAILGLLIAAGVLTAQRVELMRSAQAAREKAVAMQEQAEAAAAEARRLRDEALLDRRRARQASYVADMRLADVARQSGDSMQLTRLLDRQLSAPGEEDLRGFEWFVLDRLTRLRSTRLTTEFSPVGCLAYSPDGQRIAASGQGGRVQVFHTGTHIQDRVYSTTHRYVRDIAFAPDGSWLASAGDDGSVQFHPLQRDPAGIPRRRSLSISPGPVWQLAFLPDGQVLVARSADGIIHFVRCRDGTAVGRIESAGEKINAMALGPDGTWLVTGGADGGLGIWDVATRSCLQRFRKDNPQQIKAVAVSRDGRCVATGGTDKQIQIWDLSDRSNVRQLARGDHHDQLQSLAFSHDGQTLAACDKNGSLRLWPVPAAGEPLAEAPATRVWQAHQGRANCLAFHPARDELASAGQEAHVALWSLEPHANPALLDEPGGGRLPRHSTLAFTPDGRLLAVPGQAGVRLWDVHTGRLEQTLGSPAAPADHVAVSPDGRLLAVADNAAALLTVWNLAGRCAPRWTVADRLCDRLVFSPDGGVLAVVSHGRDEVTIYDAASGRLHQRIPAPQCRSAAFSADGAWLAFTAQDDAVLWDRGKRRTAHVLRGHINTVSCLAFSPGGCLLATGGHDRRIMLWDPRTGELLHTMTYGTGYIRDITFVDDTRLVSADDSGQVHVWHAELGQPLCTLRREAQNPACHLSVSPDRRQLALCLDNGQVELLDISRP